MYRLTEGYILPEEGIGPLRLGMSFKEVTDRIGQHDQRELANALQLICGDVKIWIDLETDSVSQILVFGNFKGKYNGWLGIGMTLADVTERGYSYHEDLGAYMLDGVAGMCLELDDESDGLDDDAPWDEKTVPVSRISVYREEKG